jgi:putative membrane protein
MKAFLKGVGIHMSSHIKNVKQRNYNPLIWILSILIIGVIFATNLLPKSTDGSIGGIELRVLPMFNAIINSFTFVFLTISLIMIKKKNIKMHRTFIIAAFVTTFLFCISYLTYHSLAESTSYGGEGILKSIYYFILITHIVLAAAIVPLALITLGRGLNMKVEKHRKIARWTMPLWLYVSLTGVIVYLLISPYY